MSENRFYRFFEHLYIGISAGFLPVYSIKNFLWPEIFVPLFGLDIVTFPDGSTSKPYNPFLLLYIAPVLFGLLYYTIYTKRFSWMVKLVIGFSLGASAGLTFKGFFAEMIPQLTTSFKPLLVIEGGVTHWGESFNNTFFVFTLLLVMYYFFFTFRRTASDGQGTAIAGSLGRWLMMVCFGAFFGSTVMARLALLVERLQFLLTDWGQEISRLFL